MFRKKPFIFVKNFKVMKRSFVFLSAFLVAFIGCYAQSIKYPDTKRSDHVDEYHGVKVADPYRWLEDENSRETKEWVEAQNKVTFQHLNTIPFRSQVRSRLETLWNFERQSIPGIYRNKLIFSHNTGMQNQSVIYVIDRPGAPRRVLLDPNTLSEDGTVSVSGLSVSHDARYAAVQISRGGSDWNEVIIFDVNTGEQLGDHLKWLKFSTIAWYEDGFFYSRYEPEDETRSLSGKNEFHTIYYHILNHDQERDIPVYRHESDPLRTYRTRVDDSQQWLFVSESKSTSNNALYVAPPADAFFDLRLITSEDFEYTYSFIDMVKGKFLIFTNDNAPKNKLMIADPADPYQENWKVLIPEQNFVMQSVLVTKSYIVIQVLEDAHNKLKVFDQNGTFQYDIELPGIGSVSGLSGNTKQDVMYYGFMSYTHPSSGYEFDLNARTGKPYFQPAVDFNFDDFETRQVWYTSKDGTKVPMFITMKKGTQLNGNNPLLLYGYGGFNVSLTPRFSVSIVPFLENGGIYAIANIRGGGEFGKEWHMAGAKLKRQNVFDDFIAAAEYLIKEKYTSADKIGIQGGSNGGLLVGACANQRPDLFKVALPAVGVMDMLRFHKFTIGWAWTNDYGSSDSKEEFEYLLKYSPLHNIQPGVNYPATLVTTADHDDRVVPAHSYKYIAELQKNHVGNNPVLIRIETQAGHGAGKPVSKIIDEAADVQSFLMYHLGMKPSY
jgi:prolyl oligopeptidase